MGNPLFGINISKLVKDNIGGGLLDAVLIKSEPGTRTVGELTGGTNPTDTSYACKGIITKQVVKNRDGSVRNGFKYIMLIGDTISGGAVAPAPGDQISIEGATYRIADDGTIDRDPAAATYTCLVRQI